MSRPSFHKSSLGAVAAATAVALLLAGCAAMSLPQAGQTRDALMQQWGAPTHVYALPDGASRLEYATGPWGRMTWMVDVGSDGRVRSVRQVLNEAHFAEFATYVKGMTPEQVLLELGRPAERRLAGWGGGAFWSWRYPTNDCLWFQVGFDKDHLATSAGYGIDWVCDAPNDRK